MNLTPHTGIHTWGRFAGSPWSVSQGMDENDALCLHTRLYFASAIRDRATGTLGNSVSRDTFYFKGETVRLLRQWISSNDLSRSDTAIFAILILTLMAVSFSDLGFPLQ